ncbi:MAG: phosphate propanoyltransferase [Candidatus Enteromonas sp.]|nr:phosphate propanoyltransferase [bacterium]MDD6917491.1 phosphate propanoyltransferase [bacterium]MDY6100467.1 phosphate propanoyltransferase [Candidatus Enteromonas sp.]
MNESDKILVETSARHVHVTQETLEVLFGAGHQLTAKKMLSQPGQFASTDKIEVLGYNDPRKDPEGKLPRPSMKFSILGPVRDHNQVEVSLTEARKLGVNAPVRESGDIAGSGACTLVGPAGQVDLKEGVICAKRHIHMTPEDAERFGVSNGQIVGVKVDSGKGRAVIFEDTVVRVSPKYALAMHIDTDESNACCGSGLLYGEIVSK